MKDTLYDFAIVGAGMAGTSLAAELAEDASVVLLEAEDQPGYHATGRSAAFWEECYGGPDLVPLILLSGAYLRDGGFLNRRGALYIGREQDRSKIADFVRKFSDSGAEFERIDQSRLRAEIPGLRQNWTEAIWEPACADIDVARLHRHYLSLAKTHGAELKTQFRVAAVDRSSGSWTVHSARGDTVHARKLVNAAGAWADTVAEMAGCKPIGITPLLRTVAQLRVDPQPEEAMPLVLDISGAFYFKPSGGRIWLSPHDETPSPPCDAAPEELAVAQAIDRLEHVVDWRVEAVETKWAGLRSFSPDRLPVYGPDTGNPDFIWFAGQGGFGIQTAPAAAQLTAAKLLGGSLPAELAAIDTSKYAAERFG